MGVPAFFRWLSRKYPQIIVNAQEEGLNGGDEEHSVDASQPNPNEVEFDNLYLDMNGRPPPANEDEMMLAIFEAIDRFFNIVRPRRVLYMAIDGVAPRAKMNQQRSRRFRACKESRDLRLAVASKREELMTLNALVPDEKPASAHFDSNCITPGTPFMARLSDNLHYYIRRRIATNPAWANIQVILSDANVPGEGEHKIMDYIRRQRASPDHDPNTQHCLCGADADLIMLGLATHEPNFTIIREEFVPGPKQTPCSLCKAYGHELKNCPGIEETEGADPVEAMPTRDHGYIFVRLAVLREYLAKELQMDVPFAGGFDLERAIDDWVFMCFFVGNDFLPHLPSLEIREHAIDRLVNLYKKCVKDTGGWLTDSGIVYLPRVQQILDELGGVEDEIFKKRHVDELRFRERNKQKRREDKRRALNESRSNSFHGDMQPVRPGQHNAMQRSGSGVRAEAANARRRPAEDSEAVVPPNKAGRMSHNDSNASFDSTASSARTLDSDEEEEPYDEVELHKEGFKERYYQSKFEVSADDTDFCKRVALAYVEGLSWVLRYYYQGVTSWKWFYPFHYAPFASDFGNVCKETITFPMDTRPFKPLEQLMGVFPAGSRQHIPVAWQDLLINVESPIIDFYPEDFVVDLNGKKYEWQGVALLPFVEENRLLEALKDYYDQLTDDERARNKLGPDRLFIGKDHECAGFLKTIIEDTSGNGANAKSKCEIVFVDLDASKCKGMSGEVAYDPVASTPLDVPVVPPVPHPTKAPVVSKNTTLCVTFKDPQFAKDHKFSAARLAGAIEPTATLKPGDFNHNRQSFNRGGMYRGSGGGGYARGGSSRGGGGGGNAGGYNNGNSPKDTWTPNHNFGMGERDDRRAAFSQSAHRQMNYNLPHDAKYGDQQQHQQRGMNASYSAPTTNAQYSRGYGWGGGGQQYHTNTPTRPAAPASAYRMQLELQQQQRSLIQLQEQQLHALHAHTWGAATPQGAAGYGQPPPHMLVAAGGNAHPNNWYPPSLDAQAPPRPPAYGSAGGGGRPRAPHDRRGARNYF